MQNNLQNLENEIRSKLPHLMELSAGCEVLHNNEVWRIICAMNEQNQTNRLRYFMCVADTSLGYSSTTFVEGSYFRNKIETIGHPIALTNVLEWLTESLDYENNDDVSFMVCRLTNKYDTACWDFRKNLLLEQSTELIESLFNLIEKR